MENFIDILGNNFFPLILSIYLIFRIDKFMTALVLNQKEFSEMVLLEMKEIKQEISNIRIDISSALPK